MYQRGWSNARMKLTRYSASGSTHRNGTLAMFCVTWLVTASSITEPIAESDEPLQLRSAGDGAARRRRRLDLPPADRSSRATRCRRTARANAGEQERPRPAERRSGRTPARTAPGSRAARAARRGWRARTGGTAPRSGSGASTTPAAAAWWSRAGSTAGRWSRASSSRIAQDRLLVALRLPAARGEDRQAGERHGEQRHVQHRLPARAEARASSRRRRTGEQHALEEHQARGPHRRRAAEPRQDLLGDDRLHQEQQERRQEDRRRVGQRCDQRAASGLSSDLSPRRRSTR